MDTIFGSAQKFVGTISGYLWPPKSVVETTEEKREEKKLTDYITGLPNAIKISLMDYTRDSKSINEFVRSISTDNVNRFTNLRLTGLYTNIKIAFYGAPELQHEIKVYRSISHDDYLTTDSFYSTSLLEKPTYRFLDKNNNGKTRCCLMEITVARGVKILPLYPISEYPEEMEILLDAGQQLIITGHSIREIENIPTKVYTCYYLPRRSINTSESEEKIPSILKPQGATSSILKPQGAASSILKRIERREAIDTVLNKSIEDYITTPSADISSTVRQNLERYAKRKKFTDTELDTQKLVNELTRGVLGSVNELDEMSKRIRSE